jgi:hypothetical protein
VLAPQRPRVVTLFGGMAPLLGWLALLIAIFTRAWSGASYIGISLKRFASRSDADQPVHFELDGRLEVGYGRPVHACSLRNSDI